jgi:hypothetical protein
MNDLYRAQRVLHLLTLANNELIQIKNQTEGTSTALATVIEDFKNMHFAGPSGYDPGPTYEQCPQCDHYRVKK